MVSSTPSARGQFAAFRPPASILNLSGDYQSDEEEFRYFKPRTLRFFDTTVESVCEVAQVPNSVCPEPISSFVYIDDFNTVEKIRFADAASHITTEKRRIRVLAAKSEAQFSNVQELACKLKMRVNCRKTQVLCMHANKNNIISSYIRTIDGDIESKQTLKILGFNFNHEPNAIFHVSGVIEKFYNKLWTLRFLRRSGMGSADLLRVYKTVILPSVEYCSEIYDSLIPQYVSDKLESVQKQAIKIIYGWGVDYGKLLEDGLLEALEKRRKDACLRFARKAVISEIFGSRWFPPNPASRDARESTRRPFLERRAKTERMRSNPLQHMIRLLNEQSSD